MASGFITLDGVTLRLGGREIISQVSLRIEAGEFIGVLGPNGAGKTTLLRALLGVVRPSAGRILINGEIARPGNRLIGYMPQTRAIPPGLKLSGRAFIEAGAGDYAGAWGFDKEAGAMIDAALDLVDARELAARSLRDLSGGERQRLLLAQAMVGNPRLLLLDEPLISLDPTRQAQVIALVKSVQIKAGVTVLFCAHEVNPLLGAIDRVLYLGQRQAALGNVDEVISSANLTRLYGAPIEVVRAQNHVFVIGGEDSCDGCGQAHDHAHG